MVFKLDTETTIAAPPAVVWGILMDFDKYPEWNPFIKSLSVADATDVKEGVRLAAQIHPPGGSEMGFKPPVTEYVPGTVLEWCGNLVFNALFTGRHRFELTETPGGTHFAQTEVFAGWLLAVPGFKNELDTKTRAGFEAMNAAIKKRAEEMS